MAISARFRASSFVLERRLPHIDLDGADDLVPADGPDLLDVEEVRQPALVD